MFRGPCLLHVDCFAIDPVISSPSSPFYLSSTFHETYLVLDLLVVVLSRVRYVDLLLRWQHCRLGHVHASWSVSQAVFLGS